MSGGGEGEGAGAARLVWLNGPPVVGKRTVAGVLRDRWGVAALDAETVGYVLAEGMPAGLQPAALQHFNLWLWATWRLGIELARVFGLVVVPACVYRPPVVLDMLSAFRGAGVEVLHVVLEADDTDLLRRIHGHPRLGLEGKRWALEHRRPAVEGIAAVRDGIRLGTTGHSAGQVAADLAHELRARGWLTGDHSAVTSTPPGGRAGAAQGGHR